jgi:hypothetical protein
MVTKMAIGFTTEYYTLWSISTDIRYANEYTTYQVTNFVFIQNLSKDLDKAVAKAIEMGVTDTEVDTDLYGRKNSWNDRKPNEIDLEKLPYCEKHDLFMICCANRTENTTEVRKKAVEVLLQKGYAVMVGSVLVDINDAEYLKAVKENWENRMNYVELEFIMETNCDCQGGYLNFQFSSIKECYYNGYTYCLPCVNGKGKKVKGKKIIVTEYTLQDRLPYDYFNGWFVEEIGINFFHSPISNRSECAATRPSYFRPTVLIKEFRIENVVEKEN